jgi:hypothetical protein
MRFLVRGLALIGVLAAIGAVIARVGGSLPQATRKDSAADIVARANLVIQEWDEFGSKKSETPPSQKLVESTRAKLARIDRSDPQFSAAQKSLAALESKQKQFGKLALAAEMARIHREVVSKRKSYAANLEDSYLKQGQDFHIRTEGQDATTLRIQWVLIGRPFVYNAINNPEIMGTWRLMGFKTVVFTDGYNNTWRQQVQ